MSQRHIKEISAVQEKLGEVYGFLDELGYQFESKSKEPHLMPDTLLEDVMYALHELDEKIEKYNKSVKRK